ncbi:MAG TPA: BACON domain-containing carbohydrate-binding protein, partial [Blastocatellia bacterium]
LMIGVTSPTGPELLVFEGPHGGCKSAPEIISLPDEAAAISAGYLFNDTYADIAVAAGRSLLIVHGRDRKLSMSLSMSEAARAAVLPATLSTLPLPARAQSMAIGKFTGDRMSQAAVLMDDGKVGLFGRSSPEAGTLLMLKSIPAALGGAGLQPRLVKARVSGRTGDDLILAGEISGDRAANRLRVLLGAAASPAAASRDAISPDAVVADGFPAKIAPVNPTPAYPAFNDAPIDPPPIDLALDDAPVAVLPMRLNVSARNDLVVLRRGHVNVSVAPAQFDNVFTVNSTTDDPTPSADARHDPIPQAATTTLRDAIMSAINAPQGSSNEIAFAIQQQGVPTVVLGAALPALPSGSTLTIDGTTQAQVVQMPMVEINGDGHPALLVQGSSDVIRGLVLGNTGGALVVTEGNNIVEENFIGTMSDGMTPSPNQGSGVLINQGSDNMIGGTAAAASNVIGGNSADGITITNGASGTMVLGNFVGSDQTLMANLANAGNGLQVNDGATAITVGGPTVHNFFHLNGLDGLAISSGTNHLVINSGFQGNGGNGMSVSGAASSTVGGAQGSGLGNGFLQNSLNGVALGSGATGIQLQGNAVGVVPSMGTGMPQQLPNTLDGISISASSNLIGGDDTTLGNMIAFNGGDGVAVVSGDGNAILSNAIAASSPGLPIHLFAGANNNAQPPVISAATVVSGASTSTAKESSQYAGVAGRSDSAASVVIVVSLAFKSTPNQTFNLQFYVPQICNCTNCFTNVGIYSTQVTTDADGNAPSLVSIALSAEPPADSFVNATATDEADNTSEFSECFQLGTAVACEYQLSSSSEEIPVGGGTGSFMVTTSSSCPTLASDPDSWVHITSAGGLGSGTVTFTADPNPGTASRQSTISVTTGVDFTVIEDGPGPDFSLAVNPGTISGAPGSTTPVTVSINRSGGFTGSVTVTPPAKADGIKIKPATVKKLKGSASSFTVSFKITGSAVAGTYQFTFSATGAGLTGTKTASLSVTVQ